MIGATQIPSIIMGGFSVAQLIWTTIIFTTPAQTEPFKFTTWNAAGFSIHATTQWFMAGLNAMFWFVSLIA